MNTLSLPLFIVIALVLSACASNRKQSESSLGSFFARQKNAIEVYGTGGSPESSLLFFDNSKWEGWGSSCTSATKISHGTYVRNHGRLILHEENKPPTTFYFYKISNVKLLVTFDELKYIKKHPEKATVYSFYKREKINAAEQDAAANP